MLIGRAASKFELRETSGAGPLCNQGLFLCSAAAAASGVISITGTTVGISDCSRQACPLSLHLVQGRVPEQGSLSRLHPAHIPAVPNSLLASALLVATDEEPSASPTPIYSFINLRQDLTIRFFGPLHVSGAVWRLHATTFLFLDLSASDAAYRFRLLNEIQILIRL